MGIKKQNKIKLHEALKQLKYSTPLIKLEIMSAAFSLKKKNTKYYFSFRE